MLAPYARRDRPGLAVLVQRRGRTWYRRAFGLGDLDRRTPMTPRSLFNVASVSKQFTAAGTILLAHCGRIGLDDDVRRWIPELPRYRDPIRIRHLLGHTSGLRSFEALMLLAGWDFAKTSRRQVLDLIVRQKHLNHRTGRGFVYCNSGYFLLHLIIERATGVPFETYLREFVFRPAGMHRTQVRDRHPFHRPGLVRSYMRTRDGVFHPMSPGGWGPLNAAGASEVISCVDDLGRWLDVLRRRAVFSGRFHREMHRKVRLANGKKCNYAAGLYVAKERGIFSIGHAGGMPGSVSLTMRAPASGTSVVVLANCDSIPVGEIAYNLAAMIITGKVVAPRCPWKEDAPNPKPAVPAGPANPRLLPFTGLFLQDGVKNEYWSIDAEGSRLKVTARWGSLTMEPAGTCRFRGGEGAPGSEFFFDLSADGTPTGFREYKDGSLFKRFTAVTGANRLDLRALRSRAGRYYSRDLDSVHTIKVAGWHIIGDHPRRDIASRLNTDIDRQRFYPLDNRARVFAQGSARMRFTSDRTGRTRSMVLTMPESRVSRLTYTRLP